MNKSQLKPILAALAGVVIALQLVPYGRDHANPPTRQEPSWNHPHTRELAVQACFDCHSNQVRWPWYSHIAPASWLVQHDVEEARRELNFSEWDRPQKHAGEAAEEVQEGEMPLDAYVWLHPRARLSSAERRELVAGLQATVGSALPDRDDDSDSGD